MKPYGWRDRVLVGLANLVLRLASRRYRGMLGGSVEYGLRAAARDSEDGILPPPDWRDAVNRLRREAAHNVAPGLEVDAGAEVSRCADLLEREFGARP